jgi:subtilisin family serine protease
MRRTILALLATAALTKTTTHATKERYILKYDTEAWNTLHLNSLPDETVYILKHLKMTVAELHSDELTMYQSVPGIKVYKDGIVKIADDEEPVPAFTQNAPKNWGLDRIDQGPLPLDEKFHFTNQGEGVDVYIVDTGINVGHQEFGARAVFDKNFADDGEDTDCNGHGTHVSSTIGGINVGIAKQARLHGVKVLSCNGSGTMAGVVAGIDYVVGEHTKNEGQKSVLNMSLGGGKNEAVNAAVEAAIAAGVVNVVAAGNEGQNACNSSPASAPHAITVAASDKNDQSAYFTNHGQCVDVYAPGVAIYGAWINGNNTFNTISGTSMASPHVAGVAALVLSSGLATTPEEVKTVITTNATVNVVKGVPNTATPNKLLHANPVWTRKSE